MNKYIPQPLIAVSVNGSRIVFLRISPERDKISRSGLNLLLEDNYPHRMVWVSGMCGHALYRNFKKAQYFFRGFCSRVAKRCYLEPYGPPTKFG